MEEQLEPGFTPRIELNELLQGKEKLTREIGKMLVGQDRLVELLLTAILSDGHILIEGVPGVAKTLTAKLFAKALQLSFSRIQFTPDLMPSDITGTNVFNQKKSAFEFKHGPIFANIVLIDEINRAPAKTQAALFECMEERQISVDGTTYPLDPPFIVIATQNPVEHEGTYKLPEAQLDRFLFKLDVTYPSFEEEIRILKGVTTQEISNDLGRINGVISAEELASFRETTRDVQIDDHLLEYITKIVKNTRENPDLYLGASPRASIGILIGSRSLAAIRGRDFVTPDDIRDVVYSVLNHRVVLTPEREMEGVSPTVIVNNIINQVEVPR